jgi:hypothetical protein
LAGVWFKIQLRYATATESPRHDFPSQKLWRVLVGIFAAAATDGAPQPDFTAVINIPSVP